jgi:ubiquinone biosynthesis protein COQ9
MINIHNRILEHLLPLVPFDGWSDYALDEATRCAGLKSADAHMAFPSGISACIDYFFAREDEAVASTLPKEKLAGLRTPDRIEALILARLERFASHKEAVRRAIATRALPWNSPHTLAALYRTVDAMWKLAGDTSIDFSFYTKRATLAGLYSSTLLYWLNDESGDMQDTRTFLKRRLADIGAFGKWKKGLKDKFCAA